MPWRLIYCFLVLLCVLSACSFFMSENEKFIQGTWHKEGILTGGTYPFSWYMDWTFRKGFYSRQGYPPYYGEGKYQVIKSAGDTITLRLYGGTENERKDPSEVTLTLDRVQDQLIDGNDVMKRIEKR